MERCSLTERSAPHLAELLSSTTSLQHLDIGWNSFGTRGAKAIAGGLEGNISLTRLSMQWAGLGDAGSAHIAQVGACFLICCSQSHA